MTRSFYDQIAKSWHQATGTTGGPLKKYLLNDLLVEGIGPIAGKNILEIGAGNGYFMRLLMRRRSGQQPGRVVISDLSTSLLRIAQEKLKVPGAHYQQIDIRRRLPFEDDAFDLIIASMVLNELTHRQLSKALLECARALAPGGRLCATITHPLFIERLLEDGKLSRNGPAQWTMPGKGPLRMPIVPRSLEQYEGAFAAAGFGVESESVSASAEVLSERPGLGRAGSTPIAMIYRCTFGAISS